MAIFAKNRSSRSADRNPRSSAALGDRHSGDPGRSHHGDRAGSRAGGRERATAKSKPWTAPRTPDGHPDLQGTWTNGTITPLERPDGSRVTLTKDEVDRLEKGAEDRAKRLDEPSDPNRPAPPKVATDRPARQAMSAATTISGWIPATASRSSTASGEARSSWIRPTARFRRSQRRRASGTRRAPPNCAAGAMRPPELRPLGERCIMSFGSNAGPPMLPNYFYNNNYQIVQTRDHVMILVEMVHDVRIIRMGVNGHTSAPGWAIRSDGGKAIRSSSRRRIFIRSRDFGARPRA